MALAVKTKQHAYVFSVVAAGMSLPLPLNSLFVIGLMLLYVHSVYPEMHHLKTCNADALNERYSGNFFTTFILSMIFSCFFFFFLALRYIVTVHGD